MDDDKKRSDNAHTSDTELRGRLAETARATQKAALAQNEVEFFENELALVKTLLEVAATRYSMGHTEEARRAKQEALTGIRTVQHFLKKAHLVQVETRSKLAARCDELEGLANNLRTTT